MVLHYTEKQKKYILAAAVGAFALTIWPVVNDLEGGTVSEPTTWGVLTLWSFVALAFVVWVFFFAKRRGRAHG